MGRPVRDQITSIRSADATTLQALELTNGDVLARWLARGARRMLGQLPPDPASRYTRTVEGRNATSSRFDIDVAGVDTGESARDSHLKTDAFFDVAKFPTATFTSTSVAKTASGLTVTGNLTLHGVTKPVVLTVDGPVTPMESPMDHKLHSGFEATTTISRSAFGIGGQFPTAMLGDDVKLIIDLEIIKQ